MHQSQQRIHGHAMRDCDRLGGLEHVGSRTRGGAPGAGSSAGGREPDDCTTSIRVPSGSTTKIAPLACSAFHIRVVCRTRTPACSNAAIVAARSSARSERWVRPSAFVGRASLLPRCPGARSCSSSMRGPSRSRNATRRSRSETQIQTCETRRIDTDQTPRVGAFTRDCRLATTPPRGPGRAAPQRGSCGPLRGPRRASRARRGGASRSPLRGRTPTCG